MVLAMAPLSSLILLLLPLPLLASSNPNSTLLIHNTCNATSNYQLCVSTLEPNPDSARAKGVKDLSAISVGIALSSSANSSSYLSSLAAKAADAGLGAAIRVCATRYGNAHEALRSAADALRDESYDYAALHVGAAKEYPGMCSRLFRRRPRLAYPARVAATEKDLEDLCQLSLDIISLLLG